MGHVTFGAEEEHAAASGDHRPGTRLQGDSREDRAEEKAYGLCAGGVANNLASKWRVAKWRAALRII